MKVRTVLVTVLVCTSLWAGDKRADSSQKAPSSGLDQYVQQALARTSITSSSAPGSLFNGGSSLFDMASDLRARHVDDIVTVLVIERASAVASGNLTSARQSSLNSSIASLAGPLRAAGPLANLAGLDTTSKLDGAASTSRETMVTTTLTARVVTVLPNGYLVIEGVKEVQLNSERQNVTLRGVVRPVDVSTSNTIRSDQVAQLEVRVNGKGVVGDAIKRPFILYRLLLGILPF
jgi:flagellar L-ring protein FlgH